MGWVSHRGIEEGQPGTKPQGEAWVAAEPHVVSVGHEITHVAKGCRVQLWTQGCRRPEQRAHCWSRRLGEAALSGQPPGALPASSPP